MVNLVAMVDMVPVLILVEVMGVLGKLALVVTGKNHPWATLVIMVLMLEDLVVVVV